MEFESILAREIKRLRQEAGLTQSELGMKADLDADYISKIERNEKTPRWNTLVKICHALNCTVTSVIMRAEEQLKL